MPEVPLLRRSFLDHRYDGTACSRPSLDLNAAQRFGTLLSNDDITNDTTPRIDGDESESGVTVFLESNVDGGLGNVSW